MIAPNYRLIFWAGFTLIPAALLVAAAPAAFPVGGAVVAVFALLAMLDLHRALHLLDNVNAKFPELVRLTKDREGNLDIEIENAVGAQSPLGVMPLRIRVGIKFPEQIHSAHDYVETILPKDSPRSHFQWPCTPVRRGNYILENVYLETDSPFGFWAIRKVSPTRAEVRVYPNAMREQKKLAALFLNRGALGIHAQTQIGKGKEFEKLREYIPGDSYDDVHWKATAKRSRPITKIYQIERTQELYVVIDSSRLSSREVIMPDSATTQLERFISAALVLGMVAQKQGDLFGVIAFDDRARAFVRARSGKSHYGVCREALYTLTPKMANPDFGELASFIRLRLRRRALLIFLTNLDDPVLAENFTRGMDLLSRHHLILVNMISTPGVAPLFTSERRGAACCAPSIQSVIGRGAASSAPTMTQTDDIYRKLGGHIIWQNLRELTKMLGQRGIPMSLIDNEMLAPQLVTQYINVKRRQIL